MSKEVRVRFAPSPTGYLHLGSARTALFNWLYARHTGGKFILRIEDTDKERSKKEFLDEILGDLKWMGLDWDEGPVFQSERASGYGEAAEGLLKKGLAYKEGDAVIFRVPKGRTIKMNDLVHGGITFNTDEIKDQVLIKSDGTPTYNFACVMDDSGMGITHIIRGDDHISNSPKQIMFYEALGYETPSFAHMPLMMGKDGAKLSKRHGGIAVSEYVKIGFLPEALANYLLLLGWAPKDGQEMIPMEKAVKEFDIGRINTVQAKFDIDKLRWMNGEYIRTTSNEDLFNLLKDRLVSAGYESIVREYVLKVIELYRARFKTLNEFVVLTECFFKDKYRSDRKAFQKHFHTAEARNMIRQFSERLKALDEFSAPRIENVCRELSGELKVKAAKLIHPTRVAVSGVTEGAGLFEMMEVLGRDKVTERMEKAAAEGNGNGPSA